MRHTALLVSSLALTVAAGCASTGTPPATTSGGDVGTTPRLHGLLQPRGSTMSGEVNVSPTDNAGEFRVSLALRGSDTRDEHPWHVHSGGCDATGPIVGSAVAYPVLQVRGDGNVNLTRTIRARLDPTLTYYADVHASRAEMDRIVACADLQAAR